MTLRGSSKTNSIMIYDEYYSRCNNVEIPAMIARFRENDVATEGFLIKQGMPMAVHIPPHTNIVHFLRHMFAEHGGGKLYVPRQLTTYGREYYSKWSVIMWGGGRQKTKNIKCVDVLAHNVPKTLQLIEMISD